MSAKFRVCLADLDLLSASAGTKEIDAFNAKHASCPGGQVSSRKSREFFAGMQVSEYLAARNQRQAHELDTDSEEEDDEEEEDEETATAVAHLVEQMGSVPEAVEQEAPPSGITQIPEVPATQPWVDWNVMELMTPGPIDAQSPGLPPSPLPPAEEAVQMPPPTTIPPEPTTARPPPTAIIPPTIDLANEQPQVVMAASELDRLSRHALQGRVNSLIADKRRLMEQLNTWQQRRANLQRREAELDQTTAVQDSTQRVLAEAERKLAAERQQFEEERRSARAAMSAEREEARMILAAEREEALRADKERLAADRRALHHKDKELQKIAEKLRERSARMDAREKDMPTTTFHIPLSGGQIVADPARDGCQIAAGDGCGHLKVKPVAGGQVSVVSYHSVTYCKRPPTTTLLQPPATKPRKA